MFLMGWDPSSVFLFLWLDTLKAGMGWDHALLHHSLLITKMIDMTNTQW